MPDSGNKTDNQQPPYPVLDMVLNSIADWVNNYRDTLGHDSSLSRCDRDEVTQIAKELRPVVRRTARAVGQGPGLGQSGEEDAARLGIDPVALSETRPAGDARSATAVHDLRPTRAVRA